MSAKRKERRKGDGERRKVPPWPPTRPSIHMRQIPVEMLREMGGMTEAKREGGLWLFDYGDSRHIVNKLFHALALFHNRRASDVVVAFLQQPEMAGVTFEEFKVHYPELCGWPMHPSMEKRRQYAGVTEEEAATAYRVVYPKPAFPVTNKRGKYREAVQIND